MKNEKSAELVKIYNNRKAVEMPGTVFKLGDKVITSVGNSKGELIGFEDADGRTMACKDIGNKKAYCFTFTIFGKKVKDSFYFEDVEIISTPEVEVEVEAEVTEDKE